MIGKRAIFPICQNVSVTVIPVPSPTPTITPTLTRTPTPTPTQTSGLIPSPTPTQSPSPTSGGQCTSTEWRINNSDSGYDVYWGGLNCLGNTIGGTVGAYQIAYTGCVKDGTLTYSGFPSVSVAAFC
jgi:hypothetical protein